MKNSGYLQRRQNEEKAILSIGEEVGAQKIVDYLSLVLHDPDYMGTDVFGRERIMRVLAGIAAYDAEFHGAFDVKRNKEADVQQDRMDRLLLDVFGDKADPFDVRYPYIVKESYKPRRG